MWVCLLLLVGINVSSTFAATPDFVQAGQVPVQVQEPQPRPQIFSAQKTAEQRRDSLDSQPAKVVNIVAKRLIEQPATDGTAVAIPKSVHLKFAPKRVAGLRSEAPIVIPFASPPTSPPLSFGVFDDDNDTYGIKRWIYFLYTLGKKPGVMSNDQLTQAADHLMTGWRQIFLLPDLLAEMTSIEFRTDAKTGGVIAIPKLKSPGNVRIQKYFPKIRDNVTLVLAPNSQFLITPAGQKQIADFIKDDDTWRTKLAVKMDSDASAAFAKKNAVLKQALTDFNLQYAAGKIGSPTPLAGTLRGFVLSLSGLDLTVEKLVVVPNLVVNVPYLSLPDWMFSQNSPIFYRGTSRLLGIWGIEATIPSSE